MICKRGHGRMRTSLEWVEGNGKKHYYCYGMKDVMTDDVLPECESCGKYVDKAQDDMDCYTINNHPAMPSIPRNKISGND